MALQEIEFELTKAQYERMGYPRLEQGQPLSLVLDVGVLLPEPGVGDWYEVQEAPLPDRFEEVGRAQYAFTGKILEAEHFMEQDEQTGVVLVECAGVPLRVTCGPGADGRLPFGTWEGRTFTGVGTLVATVEDDYTTVIGGTVGVTLWNFRRLSLLPGDPFFGHWHETSELLTSPFTHDRVLVTARLHRKGL